MSASYFATQNEVTTAMLTPQQKQRFWAIFRNIIGYAALVMGPLTGALSAIKLPASVSVIITAIGGALTWLEHSNLSP